MSDGPYRVEIVTPDTAKGILEPGDTIIRCPDGSSFMPGAHLCEFWCRNLNEAHAAGAASTPRPAGEAGRPWERLEVRQYGDGSRWREVVGFRDGDKVSVVGGLTEPEARALADCYNAQPPSGTGGQAERKSPSGLTVAETLDYWCGAPAIDFVMPNGDEMSTSAMVEDMKWLATLANSPPAAPTVQAVIDAARAYIAEWEGAGLGSHRAASKLRDAVHALASLSTD